MSTNSVLVTISANMEECGVFEHWINILTLGFLISEQYITVSFILLFRVQRFFSVCSPKVKNQCCFSAIKQLHSADERHKLQLVAPNSWQKRLETKLLLFFSHFVRLFLISVTWQNELEHEKKPEKVKPRFIQNLYMPLPLLLFFFSDMEYFTKFCSLLALQPMYEYQKQTSQKTWEKE